MLGLGPISSRSISGSPFSLIGYTALIAGAATITFSLSAAWGARLHAAGTARLTFTPTAIWSSLNATSGTATLTFTGEALLRLAGQPIIFYAQPERMIFFGQSESMSFTARADNYNFKGMR
jgi:hypothetical protein